MRARLELQVVVIHPACLFFQIITDGIEYQTREINGRSVTEVTSMAEVQPHERVPRLETSHENRHVSLRSAMRLHIHVLCVIELFQSVASDIFGYIYNLATSVITVTRVSLRVFIGQDATHRFQYLVAHEVLTRDQLNSFGLTLPLTADDIKNLCVSVHYCFCFEICCKGTAFLRYMQIIMLFFAKK